jgi:hypothetical protein
VEKLPFEIRQAAQARGLSRTLATTGQEYLEKLKASPGLAGQLTNRNADLLTNSVYFACVTMMTTVVRMIFPWSEELPATMA